MCALLLLTLYRYTMCCVPYCTHGSELQRVQDDMKADASNEEGEGDAAPAVAAA